MVEDGLLPFTYADMLATAMFAMLLTVTSSHVQADRAMPKLRAGGVYLLLPHGGSAGALSKHPKAGVR